MSEVPEKRDWQLMCARVHQLMQIHPLVQPIIDRHRYVSVQCHTRSIWAQAGPHPTDNGRGLYEATIEVEAWHVVRDGSPEEWARRLTVRLAHGLRAQWDASRGALGDVEERERP